MTREEILHMVFATRKISLNKVHLALTLSLLDRSVSETKQEKPFKKTIYLLNYVRVLLLDL